MGWIQRRLWRRSNCFKCEHFAVCRIDFNSPSYVFQFMNTLKMSAEDLALTTLDRRIMSVTQLVDHLEFVLASNIHTNRGAREKVAVESFKKAFLLYLHEAGHPEGTEMLMSEEEFNQARDDPICRARLTIKGCRETEMMPLGDWSIKVCIAVRMRTKLTFQPVLGCRPST